MSDLNVYQIESVQLTGGEESGKELRLNYSAENHVYQDYQGLQSDACTYEIIDIQNQQEMSRLESRLQLGINNCRICNYVRIHMPFPC